MRDDVQVAKIRKIIALLTEQQKDMVASTQSLSPSVYRDEPRLQQEIERIFHGMPVILGRSAQLVRPGDFCTTSLAGLPILMAVAMVFGFATALPRTIGAAPSAWKPSITGRAEIFFFAKYSL